MGRAALVVDDNPLFRKMLLTALGRDGEFDTFYEASDGRNAVEIIKSGTKVDIVLADLMMPGLDGMGFIGWARENPEYADLPIMLLTVETSGEIKAKGFDIGASDYVVKPFDHAELLARIKLLLQRRDLVDELKKKNEELVELNARLLKLSITDELTQLSNRTHFFERLTGEMHRCDRYKVRIALLLMDLDNFKEVNDRMGHLTGDEVLKRVSDVIRETLRDTDLAGRYGGDEFILCLVHTPAEGALVLAERLRSRIGERFKALYGITATIGMAEYGGGSLEGREEFIGRADSALYMGKAAGRNVVVAYGEGSDGPS